MTREEYESLVKKIQAIYSARVEEYAREMEAERDKDLLAIQRVWKLEHGDAPPAVTSRRSAQVATDGYRPLSQKQKIRKIIDRLSGPLDSAKVIRGFGEVFPDNNPPESSTVSKVFRELVKEKKLECVRPAGFQKPAQYKKIGT